MEIKSNIPSINANRSLAINKAKVARNLEKLTSGFRINRAADDAAGLAISEKMRAMIREAERCQKNVDEGIGAANTADGALEEINAMLVRVRELCVQASNGTYSDEDRAMLTEEARQIFSEIDHITEYTNFNEIKLLRGEIERADLALTGRIITEDLVALTDPATFSHGELWLVDSPQQDFEKTVFAQAATVTMDIDPSINFNDVGTLEGKSLNLFGTTYTFTQYSDSAVQGTRILFNPATATVRSLLEGLSSRSSYINSVSVDSGARTITFTAPIATGNETLYNIRMTDTEGNNYIDPSVANTYQSGAGYNGRVVSSTDAYLRPLGSYPRNNMPFNYDSTASLTVNLDNIVGDGATLTAEQVNHLTRVNDEANPPRHSLELSILGTTKNITFTDGGTTGSTGANSYNIAINTGMTGEALRDALTTAFGALGADADWGGANNAQLTLGVENLNTASWGVVSFREVTVPTTGEDSIPGEPGTDAYDIDEAPFNVTGYSEYANRTALSITSTLVYNNPEGNNRYEIHVPTAAEIRAAVAANASSKTPVSVGSLIFYDRTQDYGPDSHAWSAPTLPDGATASGGSSEGTVDFTMDDLYNVTTSYVDISTMSDDAIMARLYSSISATPDPDTGRILVIRSSQPTFSNTTGRLSFRKEITTGRTIHMPGTDGTDDTEDTRVYGTARQITSVTSYFTREASVPKGPNEIELPMNGGNLDIANLAGMGFQMTIQTNPDSSTTAVSRRYEFSTTGTTGGYDSATGNYIINVSGCTTPDDVVAQIKSAIETATGANASVDVKVGADSDGKITISSRYRAGSSLFNGSYSDGYGTQGLFSGAAASGTYAGGTKESVPSTAIDFSSVNSTNVADLLGKGFRIACGTCDDEFFNVLFVENRSTMDNIEDISIFSDENGNEITYYNYFVELNTADVSQDHNGADIVADIVGQLTAQMNHFTTVTVGQPSSTLIVNDKRYQPDGMGSVIPGIYSDVMYNTTVENVHEDPPEIEGIEYQDLPIYVSSVEPNVIYLHLPNLTLETLKLTSPEIELYSFDLANKWLDKVDNATRMILEVRSTFAADSNRLQAAKRLLSNAEIQLTDSESMIRDLDMAKEMMKFTKNSILTQSAQAMLAQANQLPQNVLSLLR